MASGVQADDACVELFNEMKLKHTLRYVIYKIDNSRIIVAQQGDKSKTYADFKACLDDSEPIYAVVDVEFSTDDGRAQSKLAFIVWNPDNGGVKKKMLYASSKDSLKKKLNGIHKEIQANDWDDIDEENVVKAMK